MPDYQALKAELAQAQYSGMSDPQIAAALNAETVTGTHAVSRGELRQAFDVLASAAGIPVWEAIEAGQTAQTAFGIACRAALRLRDAPGDYPPINVASPVMAATLAALVAGGALTAGQQAAIAALGVTALPKWGAVLTVGDIQTARAQP